MLSKDKFIHHKTMKKLLMLGGKGDYEIVKF